MPNSKNPHRKASLPVVGLAAMLAVSSVVGAAEADDDAVIAIIESAAPSVVTVLSDVGRGGSGSGVIVDSDGRFITSRHASRMLFETARCLAQDADRIAVGGGAWTPASALGECCWVVSPLTRA